MSFRPPELLFLLLAIPVVAGLFVFAWKRREAATLRFGQPTTVKGLVRGEASKLRAARAVLYSLALTLGIVAFAGPEYGSETRILRKRGIDVVVALDFSKSMLARDVRPSRLERAKAELRTLFAQLDGDRVGIVAFAGETMDFPMTIDYAAVDLFLRDLGPYDMPVGGTAIGRALVAAGRLLERSRPPGAANPSQASKVVILVTDGEDHEGDPVAAARELASSGVKIFVLGVGSRTGEPIPSYSPDGTWTGYQRDADGRVITTSLTEENERQLRAIASASGGRYFRAAEGTVSLEPVRRELRRLRAEERRSRRVTVREDRFLVLLVPAFLLLLLEALLPESMRLRRRAAKEGSA